MQVFHTLPSYLLLVCQGEFYNIGKHQEPPFSPAAFSLPPQANSMLYMGISAFTANSAAFVYNKAGVLSLYITDDMVCCILLVLCNIRVHDVTLIYNHSCSVKTDPEKLPLPTQHQNIWRVHPTGGITFIYLWEATSQVGGLSFMHLCFFFYQIAKQFPGLMMKLLVKAEKNPTTTFEPNNMTVQATAAVTAYAIQPNATLSPLFVLNLVCSTACMIWGHCDVRKSLKPPHHCLGRTPVSPPTCLSVEWSLLAPSASTSKLMRSTD